ncbi:hypothetical protein DM02DRAFT_634587 [Periconia macrospinosa]|uniref:Uncharacterized protein n=1 Tax=Periconia macrospinosa TaxID=97972 RepID=A0A2V1D5U9_9PLEO|nr:hypothetical protein DM02DRAFT_634587 [Periconia macrospinosa]
MAVHLRRKYPMVYDCIGEQERTWIMEAAERRVGSPLKELQNILRESVSQELYYHPTQVYSRAICIIDHAGILLEQIISKVPWMTFDEAMKSRTKPTRDKEIVKARYESEVLLVLHHALEAKLNFGQEIKKTLQHPQFTRGWKGKAEQCQHVEDKWNQFLQLKIKAEEAASSAIFYEMRQGEESTSNVGENLEDRLENVEIG